MTAGFSEQFLDPVAHTIVRHADESYCLERYRHRRQNLWFEELGIVVPNATHEGCSAFSADTKPGGGVCRVPVGHHDIRTQLIDRAHQHHKVEGLGGSRRIRPVDPDGATSKLVPTRRVW